MTTEDPTLIAIKIDRLAESIERMTEEMRHFAANSQIVISTLHAHGGSIDRLEKAVRRLQFHCPMLKIDNENPRRPGNGDDAKMGPPTREEISELRKAASRENE